MIKTINRNEVLSFIQMRDYTSTLQICNQFGVSESTARRILEKLDEAGQITRVHGGAMPISNPNRLTEFQIRNKENKPQKIAIAKAASQIIREHDTIIIMGGTTTCEMCQFISHMKLTVLTNSILVLNGLRYSPNIRIIMLGGLYNYQEEELGGLMDEQNLLRMRADHMFMGASGFDERFGFTTFNASVTLYTNCINSSICTSVLADSSKYMRGGASITATFDQVDYLFTDSNLELRAKQALEEQNLKVILAEYK